MARKTKEDANKTRARILASALFLFARNGYENTTFVDIASRLKMTKGAVYWHFSSKEDLLVALVDEMLERFVNRADELLPKSGLTYVGVAEMMVKIAEEVVNQPKSREFFMFIRTQVRWSSTSMSDVRERLMADDRFGPYHAFIAAVENDIRNGKVRKNVNAVEVASMSMALWDGLVQCRIDGFLKVDLAMTIEKAFKSIWNDIKER